MPKPCFMVGSPAPATRWREWIHDTSLSKSKGSQRSWFGIALKCVPKLGVGEISDCEEEAGTGSKFWWLADGRIRYNHDCWFSSRGAVKAVPDSFSLYRPYGHFWGELAAKGRVPSMASLLRNVISKRAYSNHISSN